MLNRVILVGRVAVEPEMRYTPSGTQVASFVMAVDRNRLTSKGEKEADFIKIVVWGKLAEICAQYLSKGKLIAIEGRLQVQSFEGKDGQKRKTYEVVAETMKMLDRKGAGDGPAGGGAQAPDFGHDDQLDDIVSDDLPF